MKFTAFPRISSISKKNVIQCAPNSSVADATNTMNVHDVNSVIFQNDDKYYAFTVEDLIEYAQCGGDTSVAICALVSSPLEHILSNDNVLTALDLLERRQSRYLAVVNDNNELIGIVTYTDILSSIDPSVLIEKKSIGDLISRTEPTTFSPDWILEDVLYHLQKIEDAIIVVEDGFPVGIITTKDVFRIVSTGQSAHHPLSSYMSSPVITTASSASIQQTLTQLTTCNIKRAVVVDAAGRLAGVVTQTELIDFAYGAWANLIKHHAVELNELVDILKAKNQALESSALIDQESGLANKRHFFQRLTEEVGRVNRYKASLFSIARLEIDAFSKIADTYGKDTDKELLAVIGKAMSGVIRKTDVAARLDGGQFGLLLTNTPEKNATGFVERLLFLIEAAALECNIKINIAAGVVEYIPQENQGNLVTRLDQALLIAKSSGGRCVRNGV